jgi:hypothetical protein
MCDYPWLRIAVALKGNFVSILDLMVGADLFYVYDAYLYCSSKISKRDLMLLREVRESSTTKLSNFNVRKIEASVGLEINEYFESLIGIARRDAVSRKDIDDLADLDKPDPWMLEAARALLHESDD